MSAKYDREDLLDPDQAKSDAISQPDHCDPAKAQDCAHDLEERAVLAPIGTTYKIVKCKLMPSSSSAVCLNVSRQLSAESEEIAETVQKAEANKARQMMGLA